MHPLVWRPWLLRTFFWHIRLNIQDPLYIHSIIIIISNPIYNPFANLNDLIGNNILVHIGLHIGLLWNRIQQLSIDFPSYRFLATLFDSTMDQSIFSHLGCLIFCHPFEVKIWTRIKACKQWFTRWICYGGQFYSVYMIWKKIGNYIFRWS